MIFAFGVFFIALAVYIFLAQLYILYKNPMYKSKTMLKGKTVIITGANTGIGLETAREMARRQARVILACRNLKKANGAKEDIITSTKNTNVLVRQVDLSSMASVRQFCFEILKSEPRLDILINNAAMGYVKEKTLTEDNLELLMASNHFGPFLLTNLLLGLLKKTGNSRIVNVSSDAYQIATLDFDNLNSEKGYNSFFVNYAVSKLANILTTLELSKRLEGSSVTCNSLHPGAVHTTILRNVNNFMFSILKLIMIVFCLTPERGAQTSLYVAIDENLNRVSGKYFSACKEKQTTKAANDEGTAKKLWEVSEKLTGLKPEELHC